MILNKIKAKSTKIYFLFKEIYISVTMLPPSVQARTESKNVNLYGFGFYLIHNIDWIINK